MRTKFSFCLVAVLLLFLCSCKKGTVNNNNNNTNNKDSSQVVSLVKQITSISINNTGTVTDSSTSKYTYDGQNRCISSIDYSSSSIIPRDTLPTTHQL